MKLKCVPLVSGMFGSENTRDLKAMYRRRKQTNWGEPILDADGHEQWDVVGGLPLRRHMDWIGKGFQYVTLADEQSLRDAAGPLAAAHIDWREFANQEPRTRSPFNPDLYAEDLKAGVQVESDGLQALVDEYGYDTVIKIKQQADPNFQMPDSVKKPEAKRGPGRPRKAETAEVPA